MVPERCEITGNLCGSDTFGNNIPCKCNTCLKYLSNEIDRLRSENKGLVEKLQRKQIQEYAALLVENANLKIEIQVLKNKLESKKENI